MCGLGCTKFFNVGKFNSKKIKTKLVHFIMLFLMKQDFNRKDIKEKYDYECNFESKIYILFQKALIRTFHTSF